MTENNISPNEVHPAASPTPETIPAPLPSYFHGTTLQLIGWRLLGILLSILTLGIGAPWAHCMVYRWQINHTTIEGQNLHFNGKGHQLLGKYLLWGLLILVTCGIYTIFLPVRVRKWFLIHTTFATGKEEDSPSGVGIFVAFISVLFAMLLAIVLIFTQMQTENTPQNIHTPIFPQHTNGAPNTPPGTTVDTSTERDLWYVNNTAGLQIHVAPNTNSESLEILAHGTPVYVKYWEDSWAFIDTGWCHGKYLSRENPLAGGSDPNNNGSQNDNQGGNQGSHTSSSGNQDNTQSGSAPPTTAIPTITGAPWTYARYDATTGRLHLGNSYMFNTDGTFSGTYTDHAYFFDGGFWSPDYTMGTGGQSFEGTFEFDGSTLVLTYTYMEWEDSVPAPTTYSAYVDSSVLYINGNPYYTGNLETISNMLCPNPPVSPPTPIDQSLVGTWTDAWYEPDTGKLLENGYYTFAADGTFEGAYGDRSYLYSTEEGWIYDFSAGSGSQRFSGTYQYNGHTLVLNFNFMEWDNIPDPKVFSAYVSNDVLYIDSRPHYQGSTNEIGNRLCPDPHESNASILDSSIFGTWYEFLRNSEGNQLYYPVVYCFNSDGTYSRSVQDSYFMYSEDTGITNMGSGSGTTYGTYTYSNGVLTFGAEQISVTIANDILYLYDDILYRTDNPWAYAQATLSPQ